VYQKTEVETLNPGNLFLSQDNESIRDKIPYSYREEMSDGVGKSSQFIDKITEVDEEDSQSPTKL